jgi:hypothetical protein
MGVVAEAPGGLNLSRHDLPVSAASCEPSPPNPSAWSLWFFDQASYDSSLQKLWVHVQLLITRRRMGQPLRLSRTGPRLDNAWKK